MRRFTDDRGHTWDVVVGRESWGAFVALFVPRAGEGRVRQVPLSAGDRAEASRELEDLDGDALLELLERSTPKDDG